MIIIIVCIGIFYTIVLVYVFCRYAIRHMVFSFVFNATDDGIDRLCLLPVGKNPRLLTGTDESIKN